MPGKTREGTRLQRLSRFTFAVVLTIVFILFAAGCTGSEVPQEVPENSGKQAQQQLVSEQGEGRPESAVRAPGGQEGQQPSGKQQQEAMLKLLPATVTYVVDGDTVYVALAGSKKEKVRFIGINTPESTRKVEPYGKQASTYTKKRLDGRKVWLELDVRERDRYGRLLAYVWLEKPADDSEKEVRAKMFNAELLLEGYARVMTVPPNVKYVDYFKKYQREAREANKGLWGLSR